MVSSSHKLVYRPLLGPGAFRILHLQPSRDRKAQVKCNIEHTSLSRYDVDILCPYSALSYVWGDSSELSIISVDDQQFGVTKNLHNALECLRDESRVLSIWADAICINQLDIPERNAQVEQMGNIYSCATFTIIFLDSSGTDLNLVLGRRCLIDELPTECSSKHDERVWSAYERILSQPWFNRVWILQELVLSRDPFVQCGLARVRWDVFCKLGSILHRLREDEPEIISSASGGMAILSNMSKARREHLHAIINTEQQSAYWGNTLLNLIISRRGFGATDPRDIVYAQVGMTSPVQKSGVERMVVDYNKTTAKLYAEVTHRMLKVGEDVFDHLERRDAAQNCLALSSWVPDWSMKWHASTLRDGAALSSDQFAYSRSLYIEPTMGSLEDGSHVLSIQVTLAAEIVQIGETVGQAANLPEEKSWTDCFDVGTSQQEIQKMVNDWIDWKFPKPPNRTFDESQICAGFKKMLHAWATSLGLRDEGMMPDDIWTIIYTFKKRFRACHGNLESCYGSPFKFLSLRYGFLDELPSKLSDYRKPKPHPLIAADRICTIQSYYEDTGIDAPYQILAISGSPRIGDIVANIKVGTGSSLVVIRPVNMNTSGSDALITTYRVVGTCHPRGKLKGFSGHEHSDRIALV